MGGPVKILILIPLFFVAVNIQAANKAYVTDKIEVMVRSGMATRYKIINQLESGAAITLLESDPASGYSKVRMGNGKIGYILSRYLTSTPIARLQLKSANQTLAKLKTENKSLKQTLEKLTQTSSQSQSENKKLTSHSENLTREINNIRQTSANALQIQRQRDQLQERVINLERELQKLKRDKQALEDSTSQDWFMIGAGVLLAGIVLGLIVPKISWRRKTTSWDTF